MPIPVLLLSGQVDLGYRDNQLVTYNAIAKEERNVQNPDRQ